MENASKALIMAGAILIAILIISLGVMVFRNMSNSVTTNSNLNQEEITAFNNQITPYVGNNVSGSQVNALIQTVRSINQSAITNNDSVKRVKITFPSSSGGTATLNTDNSSTENASLTVKTGGTFYKVTANYGENGLIDTITVTNVTN